MPSYTPFDKELHSIEAADLAALKYASEGWYIEYKREVPNAASVAKSISAFANTYGGWLFFGVSEASKDNPVAGAFPGIPQADVDMVLQRIRQAVAEQVNPSPHFESKVIWGPCDAIELPADHAIVCAQVPWSPNAPHVHKKGVIYRRVADGSEPRPENDRFILDQLWSRGDDIRRQYKEWHNRDPEFSDAENTRVYVRVLLVADLWRNHGVWLDVEDDDVRAILSVTKGMLSAIPFDTVYTSAEGFIGRQLTGNDPHNLTLTWRLDRALVSEVLIPLPLYTPSDPKILRYEMQGYDGIDRFVDMLHRYGHASPRVVDLNYLFNVLIGIVETQRRLITKAKWPHSFFAKAKLLNAWRTTPFVDVPAILDSFETFGIPMCLDASVTSPRGTDPNTFVEVPECADLESEHARILVQTFTIFSPIARAFGIPAWIDHGLESRLTPFHSSLLEAGCRALEVQRLKNERTKLSK